MHCLISVLNYIEPEPLREGWCREECRDLPILPTLHDDAMFILSCEYLNGSSLIASNDMS